MITKRRGSGSPRFFVFGLLLLVIAFGFSARPLPAQVLYGSVIGTITDASSAVIPSASVVLTGKENGGAKTVTSDEGGRYSLVNVLPGRYDIKVSAKGFRTFEETDIEVVPDTVARIDVKLEVGQISDTVTVTATAAALQTDKADTHSVIESEQISSLPLSNYRNYQELLNLVPGTTPA